MMKKLAISLVASFALASSALAADVDYAPAQPGLFDWSGFYFGVQAGHAWGDTDHEFDNGAPSDTSDLDGWVAGVHAGYNLQFDQVVLGIEGDFEISSVDGEFTNSTGATSAGNSELDWLASVRARLGWAFDRFLPYVTGGIAFGDFDFEGGPNFGAPIPCCGFSETLTGWTVGVGADFALADWVSIGAEYRFTDFGDETDDLSPDFPTVDMTVDTEIHAIRGRISLQF